MLKIFNNLGPFVQDNYRRISVREYSRLNGRLTPPTASKTLSGLCSEGLLRREEERNYVYYSANRENFLFVDNSRAFWHLELRNSGLLDYLDRELLDPLVILFGSFSKAEVRPDSDIDIAVFSASASGKNLDFGPFERKLKHKVHLFLFKNRSSVKNAELLRNIQNGFILSGRWRDGLD